MSDEKERPHLAELDKAVLMALILELQELVKVQAVQIQGLQDQLAKNSRNSGKPPSSDGLKKPKPKSLREKGKRPSGGQKGHAGHRLEPVSQPDEVVCHRVMSCPHCQVNLQEQPLQAILKRQVFDLPPVQMVVTEHQAEVKNCPQCQQSVQAPFPSQVIAATQYGERLKAQIAYLSVYQLIPSGRLAELIHDFYGQPISEGVIATVLGNLSEAIEPSLEAVREQLVQAAVAHGDETGVRVAGLTQWWHVFATPDLTYYSVHAKRGQIALRDAGLLEQFQGCLVHDAFASYFVFDHCRHALCNAHLLRELTFIWEEHTQSWAATLKNLLLDMKATVSLAHTLGSTQLSPQQIAQFTQAYTDLVQLGWQANPLPTSSGVKKRGRVKKSVAQNLLQRLEKYATSILLFSRDFRVPFDNNLAERDLRMVKVKQKISGCFRTQVGAEIFARIRSYISTTRKQDLNVLQAITDALGGHPFIPSST